MTELYGYDPATDTVRVSRHDLARLLLQFRNEIELSGSRGAGRGAWDHMVDYDTSFERLADAVDYASAHRPPALATPGDGGPDYRMRCKRTPAYEWPDHPPYDGQPVDAVHVRDQVSRRDRGSHYVIWQRVGGDPHGRTLCGFGFAREESKPSTGEPTCRECVRERELADALTDRA